MSLESKTEIALNTAALGYASVVSAVAAEAYAGSIEHLRHSALGYAASCGDLNAGERAELTALRRFRDGIVALRGELASGCTDDGRVVDVALAIETIDAFVTLHGGMP